MTCTLSIGLALTLAFVPSFAPQPARTARTETVPLSVYDSGAIVVPVTIAGTGPYRFLLDTGSTRSAVTLRLAQRLGRSPIAQTMVVTPGGDSIRNVTMIQALQVGQRAPVSVAAMVLPDDTLARAGRLDGLLGQDVLANFRYTIDYRREELVWHDGDTGHLPGFRLPLTPANGLFLVTLPRIPVTPYRPAMMVADTGADAVVLFGPAHRSMRSTGPMEAGMLRTSAGVQVGRRIRIDALDLGTVVLHDQPALLLPQGDASGLLGDGLLPLHLFARVTFDAAARVLIVATR
jgi:predicted aspartyl protease